MTFFPDEMVAYESGFGGPDPRVVLRQRYEDQVCQWRSRGAAEESVLTNIMIDRAEILVGARTEQGPDGRYYWVGDHRNGGGHRILTPHREYLEDC